MDETRIHERIDSLDQKLDLLLEYVNQQRLNSAVVQDLANDLSIIGKDVYDSTVEELDKRQVEIDPSELTDLLISFLRNIGNFKTLMNTLEMGMDLANEMGPIINESLIDLTKQLALFEEKGYFRFAKEFVPIIDNVIQAVSPEDMKGLADNIVLILTAVKDLTQPKMLRTLDNTIKLYTSVQTKEVPSYSVWQMMREMNSAEMKKAFGFIMTFLKNISKNLD